MIFQLVKEGQPPSPRTASQRFVQVSGAQRLTAGGGVGESSRKGARGLTGSVDRLQRWERGRVSDPC